LLDAGLLRGALGDAAAAGYNWASISGGEPLMYPHLTEVLKHARGCGMQTMMATNGMLLDERRLDAIAGVTDLIAISIDGVPESHNRIRGSERAFELMARRLGALRARGLPFGFIFTLTQHNLHELEWVVQFALDQGARLVQVHPLDEVGYAAEQMAGAAPDEIETAYAWLLGRRMQQQLEGRLAIQVDLVSSEVLKANPALGYAAIDAAAAELPFAELVSPLVIEADATVVPLQYGFPREYALGNLEHAGLESLIADWRAQRQQAFYELCARAHVHVTQAVRPRFLSWYDAVARFAKDTAQQAARAQAVG
jgi:MoaA/NifB/PqqE/SkfB family radical SAM enzyme